jgi:adenosylcobinamide hydrolase
MKVDVRPRPDGDGSLAVLVWTPPAPALAVSSAPLGGGLGPRRWVLNAAVPSSYAGKDPATELEGLARALGLDSPGVGMMTAVDVRAVQAVTDDGVGVATTVGLSFPTWAASPATAEPQTGPPPGTINVIAWIPERLSDAALVNAVATVAEAKAQALGEAGVDGTGTATDATCIACPIDGPAHPFGGPRSTWGAPLARAVHASVRAGMERGRW